MGPQTEKKYSEKAAAITDGAPWLTRGPDCSWIHLQVRCPFAEPTRRTAPCSRGRSGGSAAVSDVNEGSAWRAGRAQVLATGAGGQRCTVTGSASPCHRARGRADGRASSAARRRRALALKSDCLLLANAVCAVLVSLGSDVRRRWNC